jgi:hypothetical protein
MTPKTILAWFHGPARHRQGLRVLQVCIALVMLFRTFTEAPFAAYLWGPHGIGTGQEVGLLRPLAEQVFASEWGVGLLLLVRVVGALLLLLGRHTWVGAALSLVCAVLLENRLPSITDGGDNVIRLVLAYMLVMPSADRPAPAGSLRAFMHNCGVLLIAGQTLIVYFTAGIMKAHGSQWHDGTALYMVSQVEWFSLEGMRDAFKNPFVTVGASYLTVAWQVMFPVAVFSRFKLWFLALGLLFHVGIAVFMGLVTFSTAMVGLEACLVTDEEYDALRERVSAVMARVRGWLGRRLGRLEEGVS